MIHLFYFPSDPCYVYTTEEWFSSNFNSLEQLADVGFDDPDKVGLNDPEYPSARHLSPRIDKHEYYSDAIFLGTVNSFEELTIENYLNSGSKRYALATEENHYCIYDFIHNTSGQWSKSAYKALTASTRLSWSSIYEWRSNPSILCYFDSVEQCISTYPELFI